MPFCAAATMPTAVVLARCAAPERIWSIGDMGGGRQHGQLWLPSAVLFLCVRGRRPLCLLQLLRPERHVRTCGQMGHSGHIEPGGVI